MKSNYKLWSIDELLLIYDKEYIMDNIDFLETNLHNISIKVLDRDNILYQEPLYFFTDFYNNFAKHHPDKPYDLYTYLWKEIDREEKLRGN